MSHRITYEQIKMAFESMKQPMKIEVKASNMFPYEQVYRACSLSTRDEHLIMSGEWVHGVSMKNGQFILSHKCVEEISNLNIPGVNIVEEFTYTKDAFAAPQLNFKPLFETIHMRHPFWPMSMRNIK